MTKKRAWLLGSAACLLVIAAAAIVSGGISFGISGEKLEQDARKSQKVPSSWPVSIECKDNLAALLFYDEAGGDHIFSIYAVHPGISFGYFYRAGGNADAEGVNAWDYGENGVALISMNRPRIARMEVDNGKELRTYQIDPERPFARVLPPDCGKVTLYDEAGAVVPFETAEGI